MPARFGAGRRFAGTSFRRSGFLRSLNRGAAQWEFSPRTSKRWKTCSCIGWRTSITPNSRSPRPCPRWSTRRPTRDLKTGLKITSNETNKQIERLDKVFEKLGKQPSGTDCPAIDGIIKEADETAGEIEDKAVLDAAIVANAQAVEHYEMSRYGTLIAWAEELGHDEIVRLLTTNLNEEKAANTKLNTVALRKGVNKKASAA